MSAATDKATTTAGEQAVALHQAGWNPLPLPANRKTPPPSGSTGAEGTDLTADDINKHPWDGNIAVRAPHRSSRD